MLEPRAMALKNISPTALPPIKRVLLGRELYIPDWLRSGYSDLIKRDESLSVDDFRSLGMDVALRLSQRARRSYKQSLISVPTKGSEQDSFANLLAASFQDHVDEQATSVDPIERILLAQSYGISEWLFSGYADLARRSDDITVAEAERLGLEATARICHVREKLRLHLGSGSVEKIVDTNFERELDGVRRACLPFRGSSNAPSVSSPIQLTADSPPAPVSPTVSEPPEPPRTPEPPKPEPKRNTGSSGSNFWASTRR
jgi:hypothetical protein